jgi:hypothetical protein
MAYLSDVLRLNAASPTQRVGSLVGTAGTLTFTATGATGPVSVVVHGVGQGSTAGQGIFLNGVSLYNPPQSGTVFSVPPAKYVYLAVGQTATLTITGSDVTNISATMSVVKES